MKIEELLESGDQTAQLVRTALNVLMESPYFYKTDDERTFLVVMRYRQAFAAFFEKFFGRTLVKVRQILRGIMPAMEKCRFLAKVKPSADEAKPVVDELALFLDHFGRRFHRSGPSGAAHGVDVRTRHLSGRRRDEAFRSLGEGVRGLPRTRRLCSVLPK